MYENYKLYKLIKTITNKIKMTKKSISKDILDVLIYEYDIKLHNICIEFITSNHIMLTQGNFDIIYIIFILKNINYSYYKYMLSNSQYLIILLLYTYNIYFDFYTIGKQNTLYINKYNKNIMQLIQLNKYDEFYLKAHFKLIGIFNPKYVIHKNINYENIYFNILFYFFDRFDLINSAKKINSTENMLLSYTKDAFKILILFFIKFFKYSDYIFYTISSIKINNKIISKNNTSFLNSNLNNMSVKDNIKEMIYYFIYDSNQIMNNKYINVNNLRWLWCYLVVNYIL